MEAYKGKEEMQNAATGYETSIKYSGINKRNRTRNKMSRTGIQTC
jgi:hypothetical protein